LAHRQGSRVVAVHVVTLMTSYDLTAAPVPSADAGNQRELEQAVHGLVLEHGVAACFVTLVGEPAAVIVKEHADAIVLGASRALGGTGFSGRRPFAVRRCPCPVIVVP
jgi:nucleotide-binding universal stress UspA family protein